MVSFIEAVKLFYSRYTDFKGRSRRSEYWWVFLYQIIVIILISIPAFPWIGDNFFLWADDLPLTEMTTGVWISIALAALLFISHIVPLIALEVRRWHDLNQTGWLYLAFAVASKIPLIGWVADIANIVWFCFPGTKGPNKYSDDPLGNNGEVFD